MESFQSQFDRLTVAYVNDKVQPYQNCACWIGNLLQSEDWAVCRTFTRDKIIPKELNSIDSLIRMESHLTLQEAYLKGMILIHTRGFTINDIVRMETVFLTTLKNNCPIPSGASDIMVDDISYVRDTTHKSYEDALFMAFENTLEELKQIRIEKGLEVDLSLKFKRRQRLMNT